MMVKKLSVAIQCEPLGRRQCISLHTSDTKIGNSEEHVKKYYEIVNNFISELSNQP